MNSSEYATRTTEQLDHDAVSMWKNGDVDTALRMWDTLLDERDDLAVPDRNRIEYNRWCAIRKIGPRFSQYPWDIIQRLRNKIAARSARAAECTMPMGTPPPEVTFVIFTCRRYELFTRTMNSFLSHCTDIDFITRWICIDDNSHPNERAAMRAIYPFFEFVMKGPTESGHARSLNIAREMISTPFILALEDDWLFTRRMDYISRALRVFSNEAPSLKQVLINRHYAEVPDKAFIACTGGVQRVDMHGRRYIMHEYVPPGTPASRDYASEHPCNFSKQPHFALRPSFLKREAWVDPGPFEEWNCDFETRFATQYHTLGFTSAYFDGIYTIHIGRLNRDASNKSAVPNAYQLNEQSQYGCDWVSDHPMKDKMRRALLKASTLVDSPAGGSADCNKPKEALLTMTVTTCKRLATFMRSMCTTLAMCRDLYLIDRFIVVDDNSSEDDRREMIEAFPFFEYVHKGPEDKGHARSMNMILDMCADSRFVFHTEDDWDFRSQFSLADAIAVMDASDGSDIGQVILKWHENCSAERETHAGVACRSHYHKLDDPAACVWFRQWRADKITPEDRLRGNDPSLKGCWWPSFSLYPSVFSVRAITERSVRFDEKIDPTLFEYVFSFLLWQRGFRVVMFETDTSQYHCVTAYMLNDHLRAFDERGCEAHRAVNGDANCAACNEQKKGVHALVAAKMIAQ